MIMNMNIRYSSLYLWFFFVFFFFHVCVSPLVRCILSIPFSHGFVFMIRGCMEIGRPRYER